MADFENENDELRIGRSIDPALRKSIQAYVQVSYIDGLDALGSTHSIETVYGARPMPDAPARFAAPPAAYSAPPAPKRPLEKKGGRPHLFGGRKRKASKAKKHIESAESIEYDVSSAPSVGRKAAPEPIAKRRAAPAPTADYAAAPVMGFDAIEKGIEGWLDNIDAPFSTTLLAIIDEKRLDDVEVYKRAGMSRQLFSRIRSDVQYRPAKKTVLALGIALELNEDEMNDLLRRAGFALSYSDKRDVIVRYFLVHGIYDVMMVNEALYEFDQPLL